MTADDETRADDERRKAVATLTARAALRGATVHELAGGGFLVCRWGLTREVADADALAAFLRTMEPAACQ